MSSLVARARQRVRLSSLGGLDSGIDHPRIDYWVKRLSTTMASSFKTSLTRMEKYADMIGGKLDDKAMPKDLIYLALIESDFNPNAKSRVEAVGLWQFMKGTAKQYGLAVGKKVDERKNPNALDRRRARLPVEPARSAWARGISPRRPTTPAKERYSRR